MFGQPATHLVKATSTWLRNLFLLASVPCRPLAKTDEILSNSNIAITERGEGFLNTNGFHKSPLVDGLNGLKNKNCLGFEAGNCASCIPLAYIPGTGGEKGHHTEFFVVRSAPP